MSKVRLLITDGFSPDGISKLETSGLFDIDLNKGLEESAAKEKIQNSDAIIIRSATVLKGDMLDAGSSSLKAIVRAGSGVDNIDVDSASKMGIYVFNTPGANNNAVVELTLGYMFSLLRELPRSTSGMKAGKWEKKALVGGEVEGRTLGVIGLGAIGASVARKAKALGMKVIGFDPRASELDLSGVVDSTCPSVDEVFKQCSMVTLHLPAIEATKNSIGKAQFDLMQDGSYLINCARGGIVVESDAIAALNSGKLAGAAFDVFATEPVAESDPLVAHEKVICSPHIGASTNESQTKVALMAAERLVNFFQNQQAECALNFDSVNKA